MIVARIVVATIPIRRSPRTPRARSAIVSTRPKNVTKIGHVVSRREVDDGARAADDDPRS